MKIKITPWLHIKCISHYLYYQVVTYLQFIQSNSLSKLSFVIIILQVIIWQVSYLPLMNSCSSLVPDNFPSELYFSSRYSPESFLLVLFNLNVPLFIKKCTLSSMGVYFITHLSFFILSISVLAPVEPFQNESSSYLVASVTSWRQTVPPRAP